VGFLAGELYNFAAGADDAGQPVVSVNRKEDRIVNLSCLYKKLSEAFPDNFVRKSRGSLAPTAWMLDWIRTTGTFSYFRNTKIIRDAYALVASADHCDRGLYSRLGSDGT
jgi:hypothetical protein